MYPTDKIEMTTLLSRSKVRKEDVGFFMFSPQIPLKANHCRCRSVNHHQHCSRAGTEPGPASVGDKDQSSCSAAFLPGLTTHN